MNFSTNCSLKEHDDCESPFCECDCHDFKDISAYQE